MYALGIDLGTTFTAAATWRDGRAQIISLGGRGAAIPSVVLLREDETFLTGEAANRRGLTEPQRVAREFKRRIGDTTPLLLGGSPYSAEALTSQLLRAVVSEVVTREGGPPSSVCVSHPANWGPYKIDLLRQAVRMADLPSCSFVTEPEAAAVNYAAEQRLGVGAVVAVYDLGGGTFDAAVLRRTAGGCTILGTPEGVERLGGIDFDAAVFNHVRTTLGSALDDLDEDDSSAIAAVARLREECVAAKEALSADTDTAIPVLLPSVTTEVRLTRGELESMVRPALHGSIEALRRAVRSAGLTPEQLHSVLLVGGSSRMPIVGQLVSAELGRPVAVDTHPKHAVALGAARLAGGGFGPPAGRGGGFGAVAGLGAAAAAGLAGAAGMPGGPAGNGGPAGFRSGAAPGPRNFPGDAAAPGTGPTRHGGAASPAADLGTGPTRAGGASGPGAGLGTGPALPGGAGPASELGAGPTGPGSAAGPAANLGTGPTRPGSAGPAADLGIGSARSGGAGPAAEFGAGPTGPRGAAGSAAEPGAGSTRAGNAAGSAAELGSGSPLGSGGRAGRGAARGPEAAGGSGGHVGTGHGSEAGGRFGHGPAPSGPAGARGGRGPGAAGSRVTSRLETGGRPAETSSKQVGPPESGGRRRRVLVLTAGVVALVLLAGVGIGLAVFGGDDNTPAATGGRGSSKAASPLPADEQCTDAIMSNPRWVCLTSAIVANGQITIDYRGDGSPLNINGNYHLHVYGGDGANPPAAVMGMQAPPAEQGNWYVEDRHPAVLAVTDERFRTAIGDAPKVCARIADANHHLVPDTDGAYATGNCVPITRTASPAPTQDQPAPTKKTTKKTTTTQSTPTTESTPTDPTTTTDPIESGTPAP